MVRLQLCPASKSWVGWNGKSEVSRQGIPPTQLIGEERQPPVLTQGSLFQSQPIIDKSRLDASSSRSLIDRVASTAFKLLPRPSNH